jgi:MFS superfamily sulfate permease-like transporter
VAAIRLSAAYWDWAQRSAGSDQLGGLAIGITCLAIVLIFKRKRPKIPGVLIAVVGTTIVVGFFNLARDFSRLLDQQQFEGASGGVVRLGRAVGS